MPDSILSIIIFSPILGLILIPLLKSDTAIKWISLFVTLLTFVISIPVFLGFDPSNTGLQFVHLIKNWIKILKNGFKKKKSTNGSTMRVVQSNH